MELPDRELFKNIFKKSYFEFYQIEKASRSWIFNNTLYELPDRGFPKYIWKELADRGLLKYILKELPHHILRIFLRHFKSMEYSNMFLKKLPDGSFLIISIVTRLCRF